MCCSFGDGSGWSVLLYTLPGVMDLSFTEAVKEQELVLSVSFMLLLYITLQVK